jgi:transposase-like protein
MSDKKKDRPWDGRSRIPTQQYKENYDKIFKKEKTNTKNNSKPNDSSEKLGLSTNIQVGAEIVNGTCPHCQRETILVSLWTNYVYRCMTCGYDLKQKVNGKIVYIPEIKDPKTFRYGLKIDMPNG